MTRTPINLDTPHSKAFNVWWNEEGSGMRPLATEDTEEFAKRISEIAWLNGAYKAVEDCDVRCIAQTAPVFTAYNK